MRAVRLIRTITLCLVFAMAGVIHFAGPAALGHGHHVPPPVAQADGSLHGDCDCDVDAQKTADLCPGGLGCGFCVPLPRNVAVASLMETPPPSPTSIAGGGRVIPPGSHPPRPLFVRL